MIHRLFVAASASSLIVCAAAFCLWAKSLAKGSYIDSPAIFHLGGLPACYAVILAAIAPSVWPWQRRRGRKRQRHLLIVGGCVSCAYDLRASKDRCRECGTRIASNEQR